jgi:acyl carrier protein
LSELFRDSLKRLPRVILSLHYLGGTIEFHISKKSGSKMTIQTDSNAKYAELEQFVIERYYYNKKTDIGSEPMFSTGIIDSLSVLELILKIEELFQLEFHIQYLIEDQVDTFDQLKKTITRVCDQKKS